MIVIIFSTLGTTSAVYLNNCFPLLEAKYGWNTVKSKNWHEQFLNFTSHIGTLIGMLIVSWTLKMGRRFSMIIASTIALGAIAITMIENFWMLVLGIFLLGIADGIGTNAKYRFIEEYVP